MLEKLHRTLEDYYNKSQVPLNRLSKKVLELSDFFNSNKKNELNYGDNIDYRLAYLYYFYPINVYKYLTILNYYKNDLKECKTFLDVGAGPLTFYSSLCLLNFHSDRLYSIDRSKEFMDLGKSVINQLSPYFSKKIFYGTPDHKVDLINFGNVFAEIAENELISFLSNYLRYLREDESFIIILEPGTKRSFKNILTIKEYLSERGFNLINDCPSAICWRKEDWCHENIFFPRSELIINIENQNKMNNRYINFTYLIMKRGDIRHKNRNFKRVISNLIKQKGIYRIEVCSPDGILRYELLKRDINDVNGELLKISRGDIIEIEGFELKGDIRRLTKNSVVKIIKKWRLYEDSQD
ncbi:MAG: small ribosomal subunit Rsm22 family protein [Proteobacteria bacterium]|nr:small ribosomal subunit Rsm22 family protein [Pseudomonadota bacterium]